MTVYFCASPENPVRSAMGSAVLCQWSLCRGQDWTGVLPTPLPLPLLQLPLRDLSSRPTLLAWGTAWTQHRCRAVAAARGSPPHSPTAVVTLHPQSTSTQRGRSARPTSCSICWRWCWRPYGSTSFPGPSMHPWMQSSWTCLWVLALSESQGSQGCIEHDMHIVSIFLSILILAVVFWWYVLFIFW